MYYKVELSIENEYWADGVIRLIIDKNNVIFDGYLSNDIIKGFYEREKREFHIELYGYDILKKSQNQISFTNKDLELRIPSEEEIYLISDIHKYAYFKIKEKIIVSPEDYDSTMEGLRKFIGIA